MNRVYVNVICRQLAADGLIARSHGAAGKLVNVAVAGDLGTSIVPAADETAALRRRRRVPGWLAERVEALIASFADCVAAFEANEALPGPSVYFHLRAIERRRQHQTARSLRTTSCSLNMRTPCCPPGACTGWAPGSKGR
jgi:hypothetical protein